MLNSSEDIKFVRVIAPSVNINELGNKSYAILDGPSENTFQQQISTSFSNGTVNIEANPPNGMTYINRYTPVEMTFEITFEGTSGGVGVPLLQAPYLRHAPGVLVGATPCDAPRAYPLQNATSALQLKIGDATISQNINQFYRAFNHFYNQNDNRAGYESMTPNQLDPSWDYKNTFGTVQSPFNGAYDASDGVEVPRGGFIDCLVVRNDATGTAADRAIVRMTVREPILISPWLADGSDAFSSVNFIGVETFSLIFSLGGRGSSALAGLFGALWSHDATNSPSTLTAGSVNVLGAQLLSNYKTPDPTQILNSAAGYTFSYFEPQLFPTSVQNPINPGQTSTVVMNNIQLGSVPNLLYISVAESDQFFDVTKCDSFLVIENIKITFDNRSSLLATMTPIDLWTMSRTNGSIHTWRQFSYDQGSVICVAFGTDLALGATLTAGVQGNFSLNMKVTFRNQTDRVIPAITLACTVIQEGVMTISQNRCYRTIGPIGRADVLASKTGPIAPYSRPTNFYGGGFLDKLKKFFGKLAPVLRTGINVASKVVPVLAPQFAPALGVADQALRLTGHGHGGALVGGRRGRPRKTRGGEMLTKGELYELMD